jgi:hypothetical protein
MVGISRRNLCTEAARSRQRFRALQHCPGDQSHTVAIESQDLGKRAPLPVGATNTAELKQSTAEDLSVNLHLLDMTGIFPICAVFLMRCKTPSSATLRRVPYQKWRPQPL